MLPPIIVFLIVLSLLIFIHELGHFLAAKKSGIRVEEFGFGYPPRIWGRKVGETIYSINWIPFGGFVRLLGQEKRERKKWSRKETKRAFFSQSKKAKTIEEVYSLSRDENFGPEVKRRIMLGTYVLSSRFQSSYYKKAQKVRTLIIKAFENSRSVNVNRGFYQ